MRELRAMPLAGPAERWPHPPASSPAARTAGRAPSPEAGSPVAPAAHGAGPATPPGGAVLRGIAVSREPRLLSRPALSPMASGAARDLTDCSSAAVDPAEAAPPREEGGAPVAASEEALRRGYEAGFARGLEEGRRQGVGEGREAGNRAVEQASRAAAEAAADRLARLDALLSRLPAELARRLEAAEDDMVALCHGALCRILGDEHSRPDAASQMVRQAVREACRGSALHRDGRAPLAIHVDPRALESLRADERLAAWLDQAGGARWIADDRVRAGGCIVTSGEGTLDARLETQMAALRQVMLQGRGASAPAAQPPLPAMAATPPCCEPGDDLAPAEGRRAPPGVGASR